MLKRYYDILGKQMSDLTVSLLKCIDVLEIDGGNLKLVADMKSILVDISNTCEKEYGLESTPFIFALQDGYYLLSDYEAVESGKKDLLQELRNLFLNLSVKLKESVSVSDVYLAVCCIVKNNAEYMKEWIEFHRMVGVKHFYIYDNESSDQLEDVLKEYIEHGIITYKYWPGPVQQLPVYNDAVKRYKYDAEYIAFIDSDEFLMPSSYALSLPENIKDIVDTYENRKFRIEGQCGGIGVVWRTYGTSLHKKRTYGLLTEDFKYRASDNDDMCIHIKTICNPRVVTNFTNPHAPNYMQGYYNISEKGSYIPAFFFYDSTCEKLRINHYRSKSEEEVLEKLYRGTPDVPFVKPEQELIDKELYMASVTHNEVYDPIMEKYIPELKKRLANPDYIT